MKKNEFVFDSRMLMIISWVAFLLLLAVDIAFLRDTAIFVDIIIIGLIVATVPYSVYRFFEFKKIRELEERFPNFLRDLAESQRAGLTIIQALQSSVRSDYGHLTPEIKKMYNQISWNVPMEKALKSFAKRSKSTVIDRSMTVIDQVNKSGGNIEDIMDSLATNIEQIRDAQEEKATLMREQVIMIYAIFFIFLGISLGLLKFLVPIAKTTMGSSMSGFESMQFGGNPCQACMEGDTSFACAGCNMMFSTAYGMGFISQAAVDSKDSAAYTEAYYRALFFLMIAVQAFFSGLVCGQIGSDSIPAGVKHSLIMVVVGVSSFLITTKVGLI